MKLGVAIALVGALLASAAGAQPSSSSSGMAVSPAAAGPITLTRVRSNLRDDQRVGTFWYGALCVQPQPVSWSDIAAKLTDLDAIFAEELKAAGLETGADPANLFDDASKQASDLQVGALITSVEASYCGSLVKNSGKVTMGIEWQVYSTLRREVVAKIETVGFVDASLNARAKRGLSQQAFAAAVRNLVSDERFKQVVAVDPTRNLAAASQRFEPIRIATAPPAPRPLSTAVQSVAAVFAGGGHGTGFVISNDGYLLTNHHVVGDARYVKVRWPDGFEALGEVIRTDRRRDVALIKTAGKTAPLALRATPAALGEAVFAIGTPLDEKFQNTVTKGIVSANRTFDGQAFIQSDVGINPGNSGGPLLDEKGFVVGLSVSRYQVNDAPTGLNLFIPIADALDALALKPAT
jgi:S1-C subfamily serine protease